MQNDLVGLGVPEEPGANLVHRAQAVVVAVRRPQREVLEEVGEDEEGLHLCDVGRGAGAAADAVGHEALLVVEEASVLVEEVVLREEVEGALPVGGVAVAGGQVGQHHGALQSKCRCRPDFIFVHL